MNIQIDKGIPIPEARSNGRGGWTSALRKLDTGDSFTAPEKTRFGMTSIATKLGIKITTRKISANEIRIWRTE